MVTSGAGTAVSLGLAGIALRCAFTFVFLLILLRLTGKHSLAQATAFDFVLALILGDLIDDVLWKEVPVVQFVVAAAVLIGADVVASLLLREKRPTSRAYSRS